MDDLFKGSDISGDPLKFKAPQFSPATELRITPNKKKSKKAERPSTLLLDLQDWANLSFNLDHVLDMKSHIRELREQLTIKRRVFEIVSPLMTEAQKKEAEEEIEYMSKRYEDAQAFYNYSRTHLDDIKIKGLKHSDEAIKYVIQAIRDLKND